MAGRNLYIWERTITWIMLQHVSMGGAECWTMRLVWCQGSLARTRYREWRYEALGRPVECSEWEKRDAREQVSLSSKQVAPISFSKIIRSDGQYLRSWIRPRWWCRCRTRLPSRFQVKSLRPSLCGGGRLKLGILSIEASWLQCTFEIRYILFVLKPTFFFFPAGTGKIGGVHAEFESALSSKTANAMSSKAMSLKGAGVT